MKGEVIGIATFQFVEGQNLNFAIPTERITKLKKERGKIFSEWETGQTVERLISIKRLYYAGLIFLRAGDYEDALSYFKMAVNKDPTYTEAYWFIGLCNDRLGRNTESIEAYKQAIRIKPDFAGAHFNLGVTYLIIRDRGSALEQYKILKNLDNDLANRLFNLIYK
jgi:tetratricopeptide (TPR) repeat protein